MKQTNRKQIYFLGDEAMINEETHPRNFCAIYVP